MTKRDNRPTDKVHNHIRGQSFVTLAKIAIAVSAISAITSLQLGVHHHHHHHHHDYDDDDDDDDDDNRAQPYQRFPT